MLVLLLLDMPVIRQHHVYTGCTSPATTNVVTIRILIMKLCRSPERSKSPVSSSSPSSSTSPSSHDVVVVVVVVAGSVVINNVVHVVVVGSWLNRVMDLGGLADASQCRFVCRERAGRGRCFVNIISIPPATQLPMLSPTALSLESQTHVYIPVHLKVQTRLVFRDGS